MSRILIGCCVMLVCVGCSSGAGEGSTTGASGDGSSSGASTPGNSTPGSTSGSLGGTAEIAAVNAFRQQAGLTDDLVAVDYLSEAATYHAGYQSWADVLTHYETDATNPFYRAEGIGARVRIAATGNPAVWPSGVTVIYEDVATNGGTDAIDLWWNSVYHRHPLMRFEATGAGYGDRALARLAEPGLGLAADGREYGTLALAGQHTRPRTLSFWPADGQTGVFRSFFTNSEGPDPLNGPNNGAGISDSNPNEAPDAGVCGVPIHIIYPTDEDFTSLAVTMTVAGETTPLLVYTLVGGPATGLGAHIYQDFRFDAGEIFIMPASSLAAATTYRVQVTAADSGGALPSLDWTFTTE